MNEKEIFCLQCEKHLITLMILNKEEINKVTIICPCQCETKINLNNKSKIVNTCNYKIQEIICELDELNNKTTTVIIQKK